MPKAAFVSVATPPPAPSPAADAVIDPLRVAMMDRSSDVSYAAGQMISRLGPVSLRALPEADPVSVKRAWGP